MIGWMWCSVEEGVERLEVRARADVDAVEAGIAGDEREEAGVRRAKAGEHADERDLAAGARRSSSTCRACRVRRLRRRDRRRAFP